MRHICTALVALIAVGCPVAAQNVQPPEQSPREALIEMFMGKGENDFTKHLPDSARAVLVHKGESPETSFLLKISSGVRGLAQQGEKVETFDSGPNILVTENAHSHERIEIAVEHDSLSGEEDEIELSVHPYKNDEPEALPVVPRLTFTLKEEEKIWRITELTLAAHVPLEDPDYLKGLRKQQDEVNESAVQMRVTAIAQTEATYAANHAGVGYVCQLGDLYPSPEGEANATSPLANDEFNGYRVSLSGCDGKPATTYRLTANPIDPESDMKTFCVDESGTLKSVEAADSSNCFSQGKVVNVLTAPAAEPSPAPEPGPTD
jgi:hypothetical protein